MIGADSTSGGSDLGTRASRSVLWNTGAIAMINVGQFALMLILVRLLTPEVYGKFGLLMAIVGFASVFSAQAFIDHMLQVRDERQLHVQDVFTLGMSVNLMVFAVINLVAIAIRSSPGYAPVAVPLHWLSLTLLLQAPRALRVAMLKRALDWKRIRVLHAIGFVCAGVTAIVIALAGGGLYALVAPSFLVPVPYILDLFFIEKWRPTWAWNLDRLRPTAAFGLNRQLSGALSAARRLLEGSIVVQSVGFAGFGVFGRAVSLADMVCARLVGQSVEALYPALTKIEPSSQRTQRIGALVVRVCAWFVVPSAVLLALLADPLVTLFFGEKWLEVVPLVGWASALAALGAIGHVLYRLMLANDQRRHCLYVDGLIFCGAAYSLLWLLPSGLTSYIQGLATTQALALAACAAWLCRQGALRPRGLGGAILSALAPASVALGACHYSAEALNNYLEPKIQVFAIAALFVLLYVASIRLLFPGLLREVVPYLPMQSPVKRLLALG